MPRQRLPLGPPSVRVIIKPTEPNEGHLKAADALMAIAEEQRAKSTTTTKTR